MAARLGNVLYWSGCLVVGTLLFVVLALVAVGADLSIYQIGLWLWLAIASWLAGRALRYILAGT
jgi:hypothetical protein